MTRHRADMTGHGAENTRLGRDNTGLGRKDTGLGATETRLGAGNTGFAPPETGLATGDRDIGWINRRFQNIRFGSGAAFHWHDCDMDFPMRPIPKKNYLHRLGTCRT